MKEKGHKFLFKLFGLIMLVMGLAYALFGTLALNGTLANILPGHQNQEVLIIVVAYVVAVLMIVCGIAALAMKPGVAGILGLVILISAIVSAIFEELHHGHTSIFNYVSVLMGLAVFCLSFFDSQN